MSARKREPGRTRSQGIHLPRYQAFEVQTRQRAFRLVSACSVTAYRLRSCLEMNWTTFRFRIDLIGLTPGKRAATVVVSTRFFHESIDPDYEVCDPG